MNYTEKLIKRNEIKNIVTGRITGQDDNGKWSFTVDGVTKKAYSNENLLIGDLVSVFLEDGDINKPIGLSKSSRQRSQTPLVVVRSSD